MASYFVCSLNCPVDWTGFVGAADAEELYWNIDAMGLDPYGVLVREIEDGLAALTIPVRPVVEAPMTDGDGAPWLAAFAQLALTKHSLGVFEIPEGLGELYTEAMQMVIEGVEDEAWLAFNEERDLIPYYESAGMAHCIIEARKSLIMEKITPRPEISWWTPVDGGKLQDILDKPVFVKTEQGAQHVAMQLTREQDGQYWWVPLVGEGERLHLDSVTAIMSLS